MNFLLATALLVGTCFSFPTKGDLFRSRRHDNEIKNSKADTVHDKVGLPMVIDHHDNTAYMRMGVPDVRHPGDNDTIGDSSVRDEDADQESDVDESGTGKRGDDSDDEGSTDTGTGGHDKDNNEQCKDRKGRSKKKKNPEELGLGYEKIGDMGFKNKDDDGNSTEPKKPEDDLMSISANSSSGGNKNVPSLNGEFPPTANQVDKLPKDDEITSEEADRKMANKRKGYVQFTIRQRFKPELKYKESAAYKILAGNVSEDVERALKGTGVVRDVLFREAKDVGGPPYRSKVQVFLKLKNVSKKKLKRIVDFGLINGMITIPGSFYSN